MAYSQCIHCGTKVFEMTPECPKCGRPVANKDAPTSVSAAPRSWKTNTGKETNPLLFIFLFVVFMVAAGGVIYYLKLI